MHIYGSVLYILWAFIISFFNKVSGEGKGAYMIVCVEGVFTLLRYESGYLILVSVNLTIFVH